jgi:predicted O-methyltransferase YrrM
MSLRALGGELRWLLDPTDPLRPYNRRLTRAFVARERAAVVAATRLIPTEGHLLKVQARFFRQLMLRQPWVRDVAEVGFNAGHSSYVFLASRADVRVTSFDLGEHQYIDLAKSVIDNAFPGRHDLVTGDSRLTVPAYAEAGSDGRFDLIYIDGGHDVEVARADIDNCRMLATDRTIVVMDDLERHNPWGTGPVRAWLDAQHDGVIRQDVLIDGGFPVIGTPLDELEEVGCVWALGHYLQPGPAPGRRRSADGLGRQREPFSG